MKAYDFYKHPQHEKLWEKLVPPEGPCDSQEGELLRAVSRIYHDYVNNGFGNNWSGALNYLDTYLGVPKSIREVLEPYAGGRRPRERADAFSETDPILVALELLGEWVHACLIIVLAERGVTPNPCDMWSLSDKDDWGNDDEDEEC